MIRNDFMSDVVENTLHVMHTDAGHGWLSVPLGSIEFLGIGKGISKYSKVDGAGIAYLEEDQDANIFVRAFRERFGHAPNVTEKDWGLEAPMRRMASFISR